MNHLTRSHLSLLLHLQRQKNSEGGYSLVITLASIILLGTLLVTAALVSKVDSASTNASKDSNSGFYAAEAGLNLRANDVRNDFVGFNLPKGEEAPSWESCVDNDNANNGTEDFICDSSIEINDQRIVTFVDDVTEGDEISVEIEGGAFDGLNALEYRYDLMSVALDNENGVNSPTSILGMRFKSRLVPLFQFAVFFEQDASFTMPPTMTVNGRVHSNNDLYLNAGGNSGTNELNITGKITTPQKLYRGEKDENYCGDSVLAYNGSAQTSLACGADNKRLEYVQSDLTSTWGENILVGSEDYRLTLPEMTNFEMPPSNIITDSDAREDYVYWEKADLRLVLQLDNSNAPTGIKILNANGTEDTTATAGLNSCKPVSSNLQAESSGDNDYESTDVTFNVQSADSFNVGDFVKIGTDFDSNVIHAKDDTSDTITIRKQLGSSQSNTGTAEISQAVASTSNTFFNYREKNGGTTADDGRFIRMLNVDVKELMNCIDAKIGGNGLMGSTDLDDDTDGGLVWFLGVSGPDSHNNILTDGTPIPNNYGIRLYNASELGSDTSSKEINGLTIVSDQAIYTQGNYNNVNKKPAAILADTINVLSTAWKNDDSNSYNYKDCTNSDDEADCNTQISTTKVFGKPSHCDTDDDGNETCYVFYGDIVRHADDTTINAAFFAGQDLMGGGDGVAFQDIGNSSGGVNNYPRFHEDWSISSNCLNGSGNYSRCTLNYSGSLVSFGQAQRVNGPFCASFYNDVCNIYTPPTRLWSYDTDFDDASKLPPLSPRAVYLSQQIFERDFTYTSSKSQDTQIASLFSSLPIAMINFKAQHIFSPSFSF